MRLIKISLCLLCVFVMCSVVLGNMVWAQEASQVDVSKLDIKEMILKRNSNIKNLVKIVAHRQEYSKKYFIEAIETLGKLRAIEAIDALIGVIEYCPDTKLVFRLRHPNEQCPAAYALELIGVPAIDALFDVLAKSENEHKASLANMTTIRIFKGNIARDVMLKQRIEKTKDKAAIKNLHKYLSHNNK